MDSKAPTVSRIADLKPKLSRKVKKKKSTTASDHAKIQQHRNPNTTSHADSNQNNIQNYKDQITNGSESNAENKKETQLDQQQAISQYVDLKIEKECDQEIKDIQNQYRGGNNRNMALPQNINNNNYDFLPKSFSELQEIQAQV